MKDDRDRGNEPMRNQLYDYIPAETLVPHVPMFCYTCSARTTYHVPLAMQPQCCMPTRCQGRAPNVLCVCTLRQVIVRDNM